MFVSVRNPLQNSTPSVSHAQSSGKNGDWATVHRLCARGTTLLHQSRGFFHPKSESPFNPTPAGVPAHLPLPRPLPAVGVLMFCNAIATFRLGKTLDALTEAQWAVSVTRGGWVRPLVGRSRHNTSLIQLLDLETQVPLLVEDQATPLAVVCLWTLPTASVHQKVFAHLPERARDMLPTGAVAIVATAAQKAYHQQKYTNRWHRVTVLGRPLPDWLRDIEAAADRAKPPPKPAVATTINTTENRKKKKARAGVVLSVWTHTRVYATKVTYVSILQT